jgi:glycosyltransferase involved in cell wall biosynthesis
VARPLNLSNLRLKIAVDLTQMRRGGENGGIKFAILEFVKGLQGYLGDRLLFLFLTADDTYDEVRSLLGKDDCAFCVLRRTGRRALFQALELATRSKLVARTLLRRHRIDVLYSPFGTLYFASNRIPTVAMIVDTLHRDFPFSLPVQSREWREQQFPKLINWVDYFQVISQFTADWLKSLYNVPAEQIFITRLPIHGRLKAPIARREHFFFYPANFWVHKNHEVLLVAYQIYLAKCASGTRWDLVLTGHLDERARSLQRMAADLGIAAHVKFTGHVPESELARLYSTASCLVFPSLHEGFGIPIVEAMSFGLPIICGRDTSIPEIAGNAAFYAEMRSPSKLADALLTVAGNEVLRSELVMLGKERLKTFDFSVEVARLAELFDTATQANPMPKRRRKSNFWRSNIYIVRAIGREALNAAIEAPLRLERFWKTIL